MIDYWRQLDLISPSDLAFPVNLIGAGSLGSSIAVAVAKMGCSDITIFDADYVESHNLPNQLYRIKDLNKRKVTALAEILHEYVEAQITPVEENVVDQRLRGIVISAVDSMSARQTIWDKCVRYRASVPLYIDARMGGEVGRVISLSPVSPGLVKRYEETLFTDEESADVPCTAQTTIYATFGIAAIVANQIKRHAKGQELVFDHVLDYSTSTLLAD